MTKTRSPLPMSEKVSVKAWRLLFELTMRGLRATKEWLGGAVAQLRAQRQQKLLRVVETISLGEKRFVCVIEVRGSQYLLGGTASTLSLLKTLKEEVRMEEFASVLEECSPRSVAVQ